MTTEITQKQTFEEKMMRRIRDSIGDLISDDDLKKVVERGIEKALFEERTIPGGGLWSNRTKSSIVDEAVREFLEKRVREAVDKWLADNPERMQAAVDAAIKAGITGCVSSTLDTKFQWMFQRMVEQAKCDGLLPRFP